MEQLKCRSVPTSIQLVLLIAGVLLFTIDANWILQQAQYSYDRSRRELDVPAVPFVPFAPFVQHPAAVDQMNTYIQQHSDQQLRKELAVCQRQFLDQGHLRFFNPLLDCPALANRKFLVAYYSCPNQAGNRMHHFLNGMFWAITTNRTLLWHYYDEDTCHDIGAAHNPKLCDMVQTEEICGDILHRADWIASAEEWSSALNLGPPQLASWWSTHMPPQKRDPKTGERIDRRSNFIKRRHPWNEGDEKYTGLDQYPQRVLRVGQQHSWEASALNSDSKRKYLLNTTEGQQRAEDLVNSTLPFLYGMMFNYAFSFSPRIRPIPKDVFDSATTTTIGLHSRHALATDDGSDVSNEISCLHKLLNETEDGRPCTIYIMSDRDATVSSLQHHAEHVLKCKTSVVDTTENSKVGFQGKYAEMGSNPGGFWQDLALVSSARYGFIGLQRSSSKLLEEQMYYHAVREGKDPPKSCYLPDPERPSRKGGVTSESVKRKK